MKLSFGRNRRLSKKEDFRAFFHQAEVFKLGTCTIFRIPNGLGHFRLGITLKVRTTSVIRNKIRRAIRESIRKNAEALGSFDYNVVVQKRGEVSASWVQQLRQSLQRFKTP